MLNMARQTLNGNDLALQRLLEVAASNELISLHNNTNLVGNNNEWGEVAQVQLTMLLNYIGK